MREEVPAKDEEHLSFVERGATEEYRFSDEMNRPAALAAFLSYSFASSLIVCVLVRHSLTVGRAAGWF